MPHQAPVEMVVSKDVMVPMRDAVRLATDIYRPARDGEPIAGPYPVLLGRTSYDKSNSWLWVEPVCEWFVRRGYAVVMQDLRGRYQSEGYGQYFHTINPAEGPDGYDTIEWIAAQPWCNGRVGMLGSSHGAIVQQVAALHRPPHLAAIWPDVGPTNIYEHEAREGGAMSLQMFGALFMHAFESQEVRATPGAQDEIVQAMREMREWVLRTPFHEGQTALRHAPALERTLMDYYRRGRYDEFWSHECADQERHFERHADIPGVYSGGWWDSFSGATTRYFARMSEQNHTPQRLVMGPWTHDQMRTGATWCNDVDFGPAGVWGYERYNQERLEWFDRWLKDAPNDVEARPAVELFVMGGGDGRRTSEGHLSHGGRWRYEQSWPIPSTQPTPLYLHGDGRLAREMPDPAGEPLAYDFDPDHPAPTVGGSLVGFYEMVRVSDELEPWFEQYIPWRVRMRSIIPAGPQHQCDDQGHALCERPDVLRFETEPLMDPLEVIGPVKIQLFVSSSAPDTDFTVKLLDVYPPSAAYPGGYHMNLVDTIMRTRFRESWTAERLMEPGEVVELQITVPPTANHFAVGHRVRLDVSSSNFPRFEANPNTGEPLGHHTHVKTARQQVYVDASRASRVVLPVVSSS